MFLGWLDLLATVVPPIVGPVIAEYYLFQRRPKEFARQSSLNWAALLAFAGGAVLAAFNGKAGFPIAIDLAPSLLGLFASLGIYVGLRAIIGRGQSAPEST
ncbi:MAG: hypothetical protein ACO3IL_06610 [Steroidobacteraceae bacterium]